MEKNKVPQFQDWNSLWQEMAMVEQKANKVPLWSALAITAILPRKTSYPIQK